MDGNIAPLREICDIADQHKALVFIDECHATGLAEYSTYYCFIQQTILIYTKFYWSSFLLFTPLLFFELVILSSRFFGKTGRGTPEYLGVNDRIDIINSTLGKVRAPINCPGIDILTSQRRLEAQQGDILLVPRKSLTFCARNLVRTFSRTRSPLRCVIKAIFMKQL